MSTLVNWNAEHLERYAAELHRGGHDRDCEQRERSSLCHCSKRRREREGKTELPALDIPWPRCTGCGKDVDHDGDRFSCPSCRVVWPRNAGDGDDAESFTDDYGPEPFGGEQFGERLIVLATAGEQR